MQDAPEPSISGPETGSSASPVHPLITRRRSLAKAVSWRVVGSLDTLLLSFLLITYLGPMFGLEHSPREAMGAASLIALTEVATKMVLYISMNDSGNGTAGAPSCWGPGAAKATAAARRKPRHGVYLPRSTRRCWR